ncbi:MAG: hypothetical protein ACRCTI_16010, partial [Beijerinckiaceae bacterium]
RISQSGGTACGTPASAAGRLLVEALAIILSNKKDSSLCFLRLCLGQPKAEIQVAHKPSPGCPRSWSWALLASRGYCLR